MTGTISPLLTGELAGKPLRFYPAPQDGPRFPWVVESDLTKALGMSRTHRRIVEALHAEGTMNGMAMVIKTERRPERIISYTAARSLINSVEISRLKAKGEIEQASSIHSGDNTTALEWRFIAEVQKAMKPITDLMPFKEGLDFVLQARANEAIP